MDIGFMYANGRVVNTLMRILRDYGALLSSRPAILTILQIAILRITQIPTVDLL